MTISCNLAWKRRKIPSREGLDRRRRRLPPPSPTPPDLLAATIYRCIDAGSKRDQSEIAAATAGTPSRRRRRDDRTPADLQAPSPPLSAVEATVPPSLCLGLLQGCQPPLKPPPPPPIAACLRARIRACRRDQTATETPPGPLPGTESITGTPIECPVHRRHRLPSRDLRTPPRAVEALNAPLRGPPPPRFHDRQIQPRRLHRALHARRRPPPLSSAARNESSPWFLGWVDSAEPVQCLNRTKPDRTGPEPARTGPEPARNARTGPESPWTGPERLGTGPDRPDRSWTGPERPEPAQNRRRVTAWAPNRPTLLREALLGLIVQDLGFFVEISVGNLVALPYGASSCFAGRSSQRTRSCIAPRPSGLRSRRSRRLPLRVLLSIPVPATCVPPPGISYRTSFRIGIRQGLGTS